ncbi:hypothetical protein BH24GEM3_BH24GEM3_27950 [soil metagenome]
MALTTPMAAHDSEPAASSDSHSRGWVPLAILLVVATLLRVYRLNQQVWHDEVSILGSSLRRPLLEIVTQWPGPASHILFEASARMSIVVFGEAPFALRLPAALFGIAGVAAFYWLALLIFRRDHAFAISALYALSYHHVWFSQNARGYTAMMLFFVLVSAQLIRFWQSGRIRRSEGIAYALTGALVSYSHPVGMSIVPVQVAVVGIAWWLAQRSGRGGGFPLAAYLRYAALSFVATALFYLPFVPSIMRYTRDLAAMPGSGPRVGLGLVRVLVEGLSAAFLGLGGVAVATAIGMVGLLVWYRRHPFALATLLLPLVAQGVVFVALGIGIYPRYFAMALPVVVLIGGTGVLTLVRAGAQRLPARPGTRLRVEYGVLAGVVLLSALPLIPYYRAPKQDYLGAIHTVNALAAPGDIKAGVYLAEHIINGFYNAGFAAVETYPDLLRVEEEGRRVWLVTTLERLLYIEDPALFEHIQRHYRLVTVLPATLGDGQMRIYERDLAGGG